MCIDVPAPLPKSFSQTTTQHTMSPPENHWEQEFTDDEESGLICKAHSLSVCVKCPFDYSLLEARFACKSSDVGIPHTDEMTEGESLLSKDELKKYKAALKAKKGRQHGSTL